MHISLFFSYVACKQQYKFTNVNFVETKDKELYYILLYYTSLYFIVL